MGSRTHTLAFTTLRQIADEMAARVLMSWVQESDSSAASLATQWITHAHATSQLQVAEAALNPAVPFRSEENREVIRSGLAAYKQGHAGRREVTSRFENFGKGSSRRGTAEGAGTAEMPQAKGARLDS